MDKAKIRQTIEAAIRAFVRLEQAMGHNDQREIGARLAELRWELNNLKKLVGAK